jgi:hypothetical protein
VKHKASQSLHFACLKIATPHFPNDLVLATAPSTDPVLEEVRNDKLVSPFTFPVGDKQSPFNKDGSAKPPFAEAVLARVDFVPTVKELRASKVYCDKPFLSDMALDRYSCDRNVAAEKAG